MRDYIFDYKYTCPVINKTITNIQVKIRDIVTSVESDITYEEIENEVDELISEEIEVLRDLNSDMRAEAESQMRSLRDDTSQDDEIRQLQLELEDLNTMNIDLKEQIDELEDYKEKYYEIFDKYESLLKEREV